MEIWISVASNCFEKAVSFRFKGLVSWVECSASGVCARILWCTIAGVWFPPFVCSLWLLLLPLLLPTPLLLLLLLFLFVSSLLLPAWLPFEHTNYGRPHNVDRKVKTPDPTAKALKAPHPKAANLNPNRTLSDADERSVFDNLIRAPRSLKKPSKGRAFRKVQGLKAKSLYLQTTKNPDRSVCDESKPPAIWYIRLCKKLNKHRSQVGVACTCFCINGTTPK